MGDTTMAQNWHEQQLDMALKTRDKVAEGRACSNLGEENSFFCIFFLFNKPKGNYVF
jgi:hypothetical protein